MTKAEQLRQFREMNLAGQSFKNVPSEKIEKALNAKPKKKAKKAKTVKKKK